MNTPTLSAAQAAVLKAAAEAGVLRRSAAGYTGVSRTSFHTTRTVNTLVRAQLLAYVEGKGETELELTAAGWELATAMARDLRVKHEGSEVQAA